MNTQTNRAHPIILLLAHEIVLQILTTSKHYNHFDDIQLLYSNKEPLFINYLILSSKWLSRRGFFILFLFTIILLFNSTHLNTHEKSFLCNGQ